MSVKPLMVTGLTAQKDGHVLLEQISCEVRPGQVTGIISSTPERLQLLVNILGGVEREQKGRLLFGGKPWTPAQRLRGVGVAREQVSLVDSLSVLDNLFLSNNRRFSRVGFLLKTQRRAYASAVLKKLAASVSPDINVQEVDPGTKVLLDIARVIIQDPGILIFNGVTRAMTLYQYEAFQGLVKSWKNSGRGVILIPVTPEDVRNMVDRLYLLQGTRLVEIDQNNGLSDEQLQGLFLGESKDRYQASANDPVHRAKFMIEERAEEADIDFQALANLVAMSYDNFRRRFKSQIGMSPNQYFLNAKIEKAKEHLLFSDLEIKDIAARTGFTDPYYFSRVFKEKTGVSPAHFRNGTKGGRSI